MSYELRIKAHTDNPSAVRIGAEADKEIERLTKERDEALAESGRIIKWVDQVAAARPAPMKLSDGTLSPRAYARWVSELQEALGVALGIEHPRSCPLDELVRRVAVMATERNDALAKLAAKPTPMPLLPPPGSSPIEALQQERDEAWAAMDDVARALGLDRRANLNTIINMIDSIRRGERQADQELRSVRLAIGLGEADDNDRVIQTIHDLCAKAESGGRLTSLRLLDAVKSLTVAVECLMERDDDEEGLF